MNGCPYTKINYHLFSTKPICTARIAEFALNLYRTQATSRHFYIDSCVRLFDLCSYTDGFSNVKSNQIGPEFLGPYKYRAYSHVFSRPGNTREHAGTEIPRIRTCSHSRFAITGRNVIFGPPKPGAPPGTPRYYRGFRTRFSTRKQKQKGNRKERKRKMFDGMHLRTIL